MKIKAKKGIIKPAKIKDGTGIENQLKAIAIKFMYLPPNNFAKLTKAVDFLHDTKKCNKLALS